MKVNTKYLDSSRLNIKNIKLKSEIVDRISDATGLTKDELYYLPLNKQVEIMEKRRTLKKSNSPKTCCVNICKKIGEKLGLLKK